METLRNFVDCFQLWIEKRKCTSDIIYLRSGISSEEEASEFVTSFGETTGTDWVLHQVRPHSPKYIFFKTWFCHRSKNDKCNAKIDVILKKPNAVSSKRDPYLSHIPPLCCVVRLVGKHTHTSVDDDSFQMTGLTPELKDKFFEYFQIGLSPSEARMQHDFVIQSQKKESKSQKHGANLTGRQAQHLYNHWMTVKDTNEFSKESTMTFTLDQLLEAIPKHLPRTDEDLPTEQNTNFFSEDNTFQPPYMFVCAESAESSAPDEHLLYNLKYGLHQTFVSRSTVPPVSVIKIENHQNSWKKHILSSSSMSKVPIKLEPLDSDEETDSSMYDSSENVESRPIISKAGKIPTINLYLANDISDSEAGVFPLVFTSTGQTSPNYEFESEAPLLYSLKYGPDALYATAASTPNIRAVQIPSTSQRNMKRKNPLPSAEVTLESDVQVEDVKTEIDEDFIPITPPIVTFSEGMPVILDVSSCKRKKTESEQISSSNGCITPDIITTELSEVPTSDPTDLLKDEDYQFLMSLLPALKRLPEDQKSEAKKKIQDIVLNRHFTGGIKFENARSNIYRDCGVLPTLRDWKF